MKYRIIEKERADGSKTWHIQKKILCIWLPYIGGYTYSRIFFNKELAVCCLNELEKENLFNKVIKKTILP